MSFFLRSKRRVVLTSLGLLFLGSLVFPVRGRARQRADWQLDKMPSDLETDFALSALPARLRGGATVYLLDPTKGYYTGREGTNGFICFVTRTNWEWAEFRKDLIVPMAFDPEGARTIFPMYRDAAAMRATGKFTPQRVKDSVISRIHRGYYTAPAREGISYMLAPIMRVYTGKPGDNTVMTVSMPHYMFYAPYILNSDCGTDPNSDGGPFVNNAGNTVLGNGKGPEGYIIMAANTGETTKIMTDAQALLKRLAAYRPYLKLDGGMMHH